VSEEAWHARYRLYQRECALWKVPAEPLEAWQRYWEIFASNAELEALNAPTMVQRLEISS